MIGAGPDRNYKLALTPIDQKPCHDINKMIKKNMPYFVVDIWPKTPVHASKLLTPEKKCLCLFSLMQ